MNFPRTFSVAIWLFAVSGCANAEPIETSTATQVKVEIEEKVEKQQLKVDANTFSCIRDMTKVRGFYVDNLKGDLEGTLAVANSETGGIYPPGSVVQLVPGEVMVKHEEGYSPVTKGWEFFELDVSEEGSEIRRRGFVDVVNRFGGNCFGCHIQAKPQWDMVCEDTHGCETIPISKKMIDLIQRTDPRCSDNEELSASESYDLFMLNLKIGVGSAIGTVKEMM
ncbi:MAG: hypothetical protein HRU08_11380 [Oleispira sp.]|jgi:hypothetical protein|nr:hypothetical protein [Oleispira sp.]